MKAFQSAREAKEFLILRIVAEAQRENVLLSDVERKMLYFSETGWTLPDIMDAYDAFERDYDSRKYERKIAKLIRRADKHARKESAEIYQSWWSAIRFLRKEDHYISVMVTIAGLRPAGDQLRLFLWGLGIFHLSPPNRFPVCEVPSCSPRTCSVTRCHLFLHMDNPCLSSRRLLALPIHHWRKKNRPADFEDGREASPNLAERPMSAPAWRRPQFIRRKTGP
jgi:hypothetical protein